MSDSFDFGCDDCRQAITVGQAHGDAPFCFYSGEPETMKALREFLFLHFGHRIRFYFSDVLNDEYFPETDDDGNDNLIAASTPDTSGKPFALPVASNPETLPDR